MHQHPEIAKWNTDPEFSALPEEVKVQKIGNFFDRQLVDNEFYSLPKAEQVARRGRFVSSHLPAGSGQSIQQAPEESFVDSIKGFFDPGLSEEEKAQSAIAITNAEDQNRGPHEFMGPDRNVVTDVALNLTRGALADAPETLLRAGRTLGLDTDDGIKAVQDFRNINFQPSFQALNQPLRRDMTEGAASSAASMVAGAPGMVAGVIGGPVGMAAGYATSGGTIYGLAEYDQFMEEAEKAGLNREDVRPEAIASAVAEGGLEGVSNFLDMVLMKVGKPITSAATNRLKLFATNYAKTVASEVPTEMAQSASEVALRNKAGFEEQSPWEAAKSAIRPTLFSGVGFAGASTLSRRHKPIPQDKPTDLLNEGLEPLEEKPVQALNLSQGTARALPLDAMRQHYRQEEAKNGPADSPLMNAIDAQYEQNSVPSALRSDIIERNRFRPSPEIEEGIKRETALRENSPLERFDHADTLSVQPQSPVAPTPVQESFSLSPQTNEHLAPTPVEETFSLSGPEAYVAPGEAKVVETSLGQAAHEAATSPVNNLPEPTQAQKEAGNYKKGHTRILGMDIAIENPAGSERSGKDDSGKDWSVQMDHHYGYIKGTVGKDKDHLDLFIKDGVEADQVENKPVYVVDQINKDGSFDEHKIMAGFENEQEARAGYLSNYEEGWSGLGAITEMSPEKFKGWVKNGKTKRALAYKRPSKSVGSINKQIESGPYSRESHADFMDKLNSGEVDSETFKQNFKKVQEGKYSILADLSKLTKKKLLSMTGLRYTMSDKKDTLVRAAYESMVNSFSLGKPISYMMTADGLSKVRALEDIVNSVTDEDLKAHAEAYSKRRAKQDEYIKGKQKALDNPETYEDYEFFVRVKGVESLTTEQHMRWDELQAEKSGKQKEAQREQQATVKAVQSESVQMEYKGQTVHSKHGHDLFVVGLAERVDKPVFQELKNKAKQLGGYYSIYRAKGAIPGFQFKTKEAADKFIGLQDGDISKTDLIEQKEDQSQNKAVSKLRGMASSLRESAEENLGQERKTNTARRANQAAYAEDQAQKSIQFAQTMENLADAIESGEAKMLSGIKAKTHVELLESLTRIAKRQHDSANDVSYSQSQKTTATPEHMSAAKLPSLTFDRGVILDMAKDVETIRGGKRLALMLRARAKRAKRVQGRHDPVYNFRLYDEKLIRDLVAKFNQSGDKYKGWQVRDKVADLDRLARMGITTDAELRVALREYLTYRGKKMKADPVKEAERALVGRKIDGYFPTPKPIVERMLEEAEVEPGMDVLEPSAGKGNIADLIKEDEPEANLETIEPVQDLRTILEAKEHNLVGRNFLEHDGEYDRIIMNPPFEKRQDVEHVRNAYKLLKPGGRVVAIMSEGPFFGKDKVATDFREWLNTVGWSEKLPEGSFKSSERPTGVATRLVVIDKPDAVSGGNAAETSVKSPETTSIGAVSDERHQDTERRHKRVLGERDSGRRARPSSGDQGPEEGKGTGSENQNSNRSTQGSAVSVLHSEGEDAGHYELREASDLIPSHQATQGFKKHEAYPDDVQERPYHSDKNEQIKVKTNASQLDPRFVVSDNPDAVNGPPIITSDGIVLGGNSRTMSIQYAYENYPDKAGSYVDALKRKAESFGLDSSDVNSFRQPVLVRSIDDSISRKDMARKARLYNQSRMQGLDSTAEGISKGRMISKQSMATLAQALEDFSTLRSYLDSNSSRKLIDSLLADGVLESTQIGKLSKGTGLLNSEGKRLVELAVRGHIIDDFDTLDRLPDSILEKLDRIVPAASKVKNRGGDWDITPILKNALQHVVKFRASKAETLDTYFGQATLFGEDSSKSNPLVQRLARAAVSAKPTVFRGMWTEYAKKAVADKKDQAALPGAEPVSPEEAQRAFEDKTRFSFSKSNPAKGSTVAEVKEVISKLETASVNAGRTEVVQSVEDLPQHIQDEFNATGGGVLEAAYHDGKTYIVADSIPNSKRAVQLWMHEQGVHHGLRGFFGEKDLKQFLSKVHLSAAKSSIYKNIVDLYGLDINKAEDRQMAAEEYLAHVGEKVGAGEALSGREKSIWQQIVAMFRRWLNQLSFSKDATLTYAEIEQTVADVISWTVHGPAGQLSYDADPAVAFSKDATEEQLEAGRQLQEDIDEWSQQLDNFSKGKFNSRKDLQLGETPDVLRKLGIPARPMVMVQSDVAKVMSDREDHAIPLESLKQLPRQLAAPVMVFKSATVPDAFVFLTEIKLGRKSVMAAVHYDTKSQHVKVNKVASMYGRWPSWYARQMEEGRLVYRDKKKSLAWARTNGLQLPKVPLKRGNNKIITEKDIVKPVLPGDALRFSRGEMTAQQVVETVNEPEIRNFLNDKDLSALQEVGSLPHWIAKRFPEFQKIYEVHLGRMEKRSAMFSDSLAEVEDFFTGLNKKELQEISDMVWKLDGEKIKDITESKFVVATDKDGKKVRENGRAVLESNPEFYEQFEKWLKGQGMSKKAAKVFLAVRKSLDSDFLRAYDAMRQMSDISDSDLDQFRKNINHIQNYFPHHRYGQYYVAGYADDGNGARVCVYREHFDALNKLRANTIAADKIKELKEKYPDVHTWDKGKNQRLPEEVYGVPIDSNAMEQVIASAASSIADPDQAGDIRNKLTQAVSDVLKSRGWGSHAIGRKNIPGHETEDIRRVLYDYKAGLTGWLTKMEASKEMTAAVGKINARKNPKLYRYALTYVQNMLRNSDSIDRAVGNVKSLAFAWYLGGNIKTAALNLTQNIITGVPRLGMETNAGSIKIFNAAASSIVSAASGSKNLTKDEQRLLDDMYKEGIITEAFLDEIRGEVSGISGSRAWNKTLKWMGMPMAIAERFNRATLALAAYRVARDGQLKRQETKDALGLKEGDKASYDQSKQFAEGLVNDAHFVYGKANLPQPFRSSTLGRLGSSMYTFRTFSHNLLSLWGWMLRSQGKEGAKAFGKSLFATASLGGVTALPFYYSAMAITQALTGDDDDWTEEVRKKLPESDIARDIVCYGVPAMAGISMGGSLGIEVPLARHIEPGADAESVVAGNIGEILGIPYDLLMKPSKVAKYSRAGDNYRAVEEAAPTVIKNMMKAYRMYTEGQTSLSGRPINEPGKIGPRKLELGEAIKKGFGFQPLESTKNWNNYRARSISSKLRKDKLANLSNNLIRAIRDNDRERMMDIFADLNKWNKSAFEDKKVWLVISPADIKRGIASRAKVRGMSKRDLFRMAEQMK
ncbi:PLxRFG domain-containing protein [Maridesulfovibrio sp.]|uniref:PLxRFG domain-containing protein n=1 Tax=Maridesulfovibrio sp. TaxID=2795000 RepID=UPI0029C9CE26|nr:PLxRFG domain-containing protein [Maridesulfovibrio sp.]